MVNATDRDDFDLLLSESARQHDASSTRTWRATLLVVPWLGAVAYVSPRPASGDRRHAMFGALPR